MALKLQPEQESALKAEAEAQGIITEQWLELLIEERLQSVRWPDSDEEQLQSEPFWKTFTRRMHALPTEVFDRLPADSASEHDHYLSSMTTISMVRAGDIDKRAGGRAFAE